MVIQFILLIGVNRGKLGVEDRLSISGVSGIYSWENKINGHIYIGSSTDLYERFSRYHRPSCDLESLPGYNYPLYQAFRKYVPNNFYFHVLYISNNGNSKCLKQLEQEYITKCNPYYNKHMLVNSGKLVILLDIPSKKTITFL